MTYNPPIPTYFVRFLRGDVLLATTVSTENQAIYYKENCLGPNDKYVDCYKLMPEPHKLP